MEAKRKHDFEGCLLEAGFLSIEQVAEYSDQTLPLGLNWL